jgi:hypothetical protein
MLPVFALLPVVAADAGGQWNADRPFAAGAVIVGAQGFARPPITSAVGAVYGHVPVHPALLLGAQGAATFAEPDRSHATYAVATIAYAQRRAALLQIYPFVGAGAAALRTQPGEASWRPAFAAGFGVDILSGPGGPSPMLGARIGYLTRSMGDDESIAYAALGFGFGGRRAERDEPRAIAGR